jgi:hypothetical protein
MELKACTIQKLLNFLKGGGGGGLGGKEEGEDRSQSRNFPYFTVREDSFPSLNNMKLVHIQALYYITIYFNIKLHLRLDLPHDLPPSEIWTKI